MSEFERATHGVTDVKGSKMLCCAAVVMSTFKGNATVGLGLGCPNPTLSSMGFLMEYSSNLVLPFGHLVFKGGLPKRLGAYQFIIRIQFQGMRRESCI